MATTSNFGWETPDDTDYVKDGAAAMRTLGNSIDASMADLKGGTTGQVLSKATNTDMDFVWVTQDDADAIQNSIIDAKGDLIVGTAADTPARLAVGTNGQILQADSTAATGLKWATPAAAGGMTLIATATPSAATTVSFTSIPTTYRELKIVYSAIQDLNNATWLMRLNNDSGANYDNVWIWTQSTFGYNQQVGTNQIGISGTDFAQPIPRNGTTGASNGAWGEIVILNANQTTNNKVWKAKVKGYNSSNHSYSDGIGLYRGTSAITQIDFIRSSTQTITGTFYLYGLA